jgi:hypothetical protein
MTETEDEQRRRALRIAYRRQLDACEEGVTEFARLAGIVQRDKGRNWCGHNLLGKRPDWIHRGQCAGDGWVSSWWDHVRGFGLGRRPLVLLGWPYGARERIEGRVRGYAERLGLNWHVGRADGPLSLYFWGAATPWAITAPDIDAAAMFELGSPALDDVYRRLADYSRTRQDVQARRAIEQATQ